MKLYFAGCPGAPRRNEKSMMPLLQKRLLSYIYIIGKPYSLGEQKTIWRLIKEESNADSHA